MKGGYLVREAHVDAARGESYRVVIFLHFKPKRVCVAMFKETTLLDKAIEQNLFPPLETFDSPYDTCKANTGAIRIVFPEFTCVCPKTGYPDFGAIKIFYLPEKTCIELKSWKLYLNSFRMIGTFHETVTAHIFATFRAAVKPRWAMIIGDFFPRGNVDTTIVFETDSPRPAGVDVLIDKTEPYCRGF